MGADIEERPIDGATADDGVGEPTADLSVRSSELRAIDVSPTRSPRRSTRSRSSAWPRPGPWRDHDPWRRRAAPQGVDRIAGVAAGLSALGATVEVDGDDLRIHGDARLGRRRTDSLDDHRLAMTFAIAGSSPSGDHHRAARFGRGLLSRVLRRPRRVRA
jgi:3-phosphoshikimate 1-carboxyvinyltransferase